MGYLSESPYRESVRIKMALYAELDHRPITWSILPMVGRCSGGSYASGNSYIYDGQRVVTRIASRYIGHGGAALVAYECCSYRNHKHAHCVYAENSRAHQFLNLQMRSPLSQC